MSTDTLTHLSNNPETANNAQPEGAFCTAFGTRCYRISNVHRLPPFFINLVSSTDLWMFIASNGALTAGRRDAECSLFPYQTVDRIYDSAGQIGPITLFGVETGGSEIIWQPFGPNTNHLSGMSRHLYKSIEGDRIWFEEVREDLGLVFCASWSTADSHGFVRHCTLRRLSGNTVRIRLLDGLRNILPAGVSQRLQSLSSNLVDAYKTSTLIPDSTCAVFALQSQIVDLPKPVEATRASIVWSTGLPDATIALSDRQIDTFRAGGTLRSEPHTRGLRGAYILSATLELPPEQAVEWQLVADTNLDQTQVVARGRQSQDPHARASLQTAIEASTQQLRQLVAAADGCQTSADEATTAHHFANVMFNVMRGGTFMANHRLPLADFAAHVAIHNKGVAHRHVDFLAGLPIEMERSELISRVTALADPDFTRIASSYLPLSFSRRHGDPSRPWNKFSIRLRDSQGQRRLAYEGNWRDIFQNWEALCLSYPEFLDAAIAKFLNASTADGYNPYRITQAGIDWEEPDPEDPWASIGYWGDHQVIYLLKLLEWSARLHPSRLAGRLRPAEFSYADVPYRISGYDDLRRDPRNTIAFDSDYNKTIGQRVAAVGADGRLLPGASGAVQHANLTEKLLVLVLVRMTNFIPGGGIWMNTQRPEWNDANNALVGYGVSVVTLNYLRRLIAFTQDTVWPLLGDASVAISENVATLARDVSAALEKHREVLSQADFTEEQGRALVDDLASAGALYRERLYADGLGPAQLLEPADLKSLFATALAFVDHSIQSNRRPDNLFHAYNLLSFSDAPDTLEVSRLPLMLEGQVAALSSGLLTTKEVVHMLQALKESDIFRTDLHTYLLYPDRQLPGFLQRNIIAESEWATCPIFERMLTEGEHRLVQRDAAGAARFHADLVDGESLEGALAQLAQDPHWGADVEAASDQIRGVYEQVFNHRAFTGRSGGMFGFEGLGCVYWHMVAKLLLAVQENLLAAQAEDSTEAPALIDAYYDVRSGLGFNHTPAVFGAFPTDPYSHTPGHAGAQQPGMTGQVKEEILTRLGELGVMFSNGKVRFAPTFLRAAEFHPTSVNFDYIDIAGNSRSLSLPAMALAFTVAGVPIVYHQSKGNSRHIVHWINGKKEAAIESGTELDQSTSDALLQRRGKIDHIVVELGSDLPLLS
ncbi:MAG: hypothetical protein SynsKO_26900 [Synoicihabitans sp.]